MTKSHDLDDNTRFAMPVRNLISLIVAVALGVWAYFGVIERLNKIETQIVLIDSDLVKNTEFRIKWPRGDLGSLPADSEQFMLIEHMAGQLEKIEKQMSNMMHNEVNIERLQKDVSKLQSDVEKLKDKQRQFANGNGNH